MSISAPLLGLANWLRQCREGRGMILRDVASRTGLDLSLVSRFENGQRVPTEEQMAMLASVFGANPQQAQALRIADQFRRKYGDGPATHHAILRLAEEEGILRETSSKGKKG
jgi:transcriptional regulator with XRE-family HTH domain